MIKIKNKSKCSGCHACVNVCPKQCISMKHDDEGFLYPNVDKTKCIECKLCEKVCNSIKPLVSNNHPESYACYNSNENIRMSSSSGGMFTLFAERIIEQGGVVFGAAFDDDLAVKHVCIDNREDLYKLRGSKYLQSIIGDTYKQAKEILQTGRKVLFTGTPCQIDGLLQLLGKSYDNLYTQDIICHGVPSPKVWEAYLGYQEALHKDKVDKTNRPSFRTKNLGWLNYSVQIHFENNKEYNVPHGDDLFIKTFLSNLSLRPSCYNCKSKGLRRNSDITLADFWGVNILIPDMFDDKGTSLIFINTEKGNFLFEQIKKFSIYKKVDIKTAVKYNPSAYSASSYPSQRKRFMKNVSICDFKTLQHTCGGKRSFVEKIYNKFKRILSAYRNQLL